MIRTFVVSWLLFFVWSGACAQSPVQALVPSLIEPATRARQAVLDRSDKSPYDVAYEINEAVKKATDVLKDPADAPKALEILHSLEPSLGTLKLLPSRQLHQLLGAIAGMEQRTQDQYYHRAYALALIFSLSRTGNGETPETAFRVISIGEEYDWFFFNQQAFKPIDRVLKDIGDRRYDVWRIRLSSGQEKTLYFDVTQMQESAARTFGRSSEAASSPAR